MSTAAVQSGDLFGTSALDRDDLDVIEATLSWRGDPMAVKHVSVGAALTLGEASGADFTIPASELGADRLSIRADGASDHVFGAFTLALRVVPAGRVAPFGVFEAVKESALGSVGGSFMLHAMIVASLAMFMPSLGANDDESITRDQLLTKQKYLTSAAENERERMFEESANSTGAAESTAAGTAAMGESGSMGSTTAEKTNHHYSARGDANPHDATLSRERQLEEARTGGMIGLLASSFASDVNAPISPWGSVLNGADKASHNGAMWGDEAGENWGLGGLGLSGVGEGGCPPGQTHCGQGVGLSDVGGLGHSLQDHMGTCVGPNCDGRGNGHSPLRGGHVSHFKAVRMCGEQSCGFEANGRLPAEVIQRIVRQNMGRYRNCYEAGLRGNPSLTGHVRVKFVIDRTGAVSMAQDSGSDLPDQGVASCVVKSFYSLAFPPPQGGTVSVVYPIILTPSE